MKSILKSVPLVALITISVMGKSGTRVIQEESDFFERLYAERQK